MYSFDLEHEDYLPKAKTSGSAGMDVVAKRGVTIPPGSQFMIGTGVKLKDCSNGIYFKLCIRSSLRAIGLSDLSFGIIDSDYRDEIKVIIKNLSRKTVEIKRLDRIAQLIPTPKMQIPEAYIENTIRNGGFGSTGK